MLLTDLYQLTMAFGYWKAGVAEREAAFHLSFRENPFGGGFAVCCGLSDVIDHISAFHLADDEAAYLASLNGPDGAPLFEAAFLDYLRQLRLTCDIHAISEGTVVFPHEPLVRVRGPIVQGQLLETALLNIINFQSLIATKAARVCHAAGDDPVLEFGLRRAQGVDGAMAASRAAHIGGCAATSNVLAGMRFGIPVRGTHAHSWVMCFDSEEAAFEAYARAMPNNCVFLVDTYDTLEGVRTAVRVGKRLRERGHELVGVRLDSGDLAHLSAEARRILDEGGFPKATIVASNDLDEHGVASLKAEGARIAVWGIGTRLVTGHSQPAMGGVYKLGAVREPGNDWRRILKLSEEPSKISNPGLQQVRRFRKDGKFVGDFIYDEIIGLTGEKTILDPETMTARGRIPEGSECEDLLVPIFERGSMVYRREAIHAARERLAAQLSGFGEGVKRLSAPDRYPVGLEAGLHRQKSRLILEARSRARS